MIGFKKIIIFLVILSLVLSDKISGLDTTCNQYWRFDRLDNKCAIDKCDTSRTLFGNRQVNDSFCGSCPTDLANNSVNSRQKYANIDQNFSVSAQASCTNRQGLDWTDYDYNTCGHKDGKYTKADKSVCTKSISTVGKEVPFQNNNSYDALVLGILLFNGFQQLKVKKTVSFHLSQPPFFPNQYLTDLMCSSNPDLTNTNNFASNDKTSCVNAPAFVGNPVPCQKNGNCDSCPAKVGFSWQLTQNSQSHCQIKSCFANNFPEEGLTNFFCGSCPPDSDKKRVYASEDKKLCVLKSQDPQQTNEQNQNKPSQQQQTFSYALSLNIAICQILLIMVLLFQQQSNQFQINKSKA
ncbi:hypothetical protein ABPG72_020573 [Tetrahymena utriculariae]